MGATPLAGLNGAFALAQHVFRCMQWSANFIQDINDASGFGSGDRNNVAGMRVMRGTASGYLLAHAASQAPAANMSGAADQSTTGQAFTLTADTGCTYTGFALVSSATPSQSASGVGTFTVSFVSTGSVTETWATS